MTKLIWIKPNNHGRGLWLLCVTGPNDIVDDVVNGVVNRLHYLVQPIPLRWSSSAWHTLVPSGKSLTLLMSLLLRKNLNLLCLRFCVGFKAWLCRNLSGRKKLIFFASDCVLVSRPDFARTWVRPLSISVFCAALDLTRNLALTTILLTSRSVRVDPESVNSAAIDVDPQNKFVRMMVSALSEPEPWWSDHHRPRHHHHAADSWHAGHHVPSLHTHGRAQVGGSVLLAHSVSVVLSSSVSFVSMCASLIA